MPPSVRGESNYSTICNISTTFQVLSCISLSFLTSRNYSERTRFQLLILQRISYSRRLGLSHLFRTGMASYALDSGFLKHCNTTDYSAGMESSEIFPVNFCLERILKSGCDFFPNLFTSTYQQRSTNLHSYC